MPDTSTRREGAPPAPRRRWELRFGTIGGIPIRLHITLLLLFVWCVFAAIVLHELMHALVARRFGVRTRDILLLPIGGIASLERIPDRPSQELAIALAGPAFNLVVAGVLALGLRLAGSELTLAGASAGEAFALQLMWINVVLAAFNLLPAFPLDGGRALRAGLASALPRGRATAIAAGLGQGIAVLIGLVGLWFNPWLVLIAVFVWLAARGELALVRTRAALAGVPASAAMLEQIVAVRVDESLATAAELLVHHGNTAIPVVQDGATIGALTRDDIAAGIELAGPQAPVAAAPHHEVVPVAPTESLDLVLERLGADRIGVVVDGNVPIGLVTPEQLASYVALHPRPGAAAPTGRHSRA
jgi:Zn-dependent protease